MFELLVNLIFWLITKLTSLIFTPIIGFLTSVFPVLDDLIDGVKFFLSNYVFTFLQWFKMVCINVLAFPQELLSFLVSTFTIIMTIYLGMLTYKCIVTVYNKLKP